MEEPRKIDTAISLAEIEYELLQMRALNRVESGNVHNVADEKLLEALSIVKQNLTLKLLRDSVDGIIDAYKELRGW